tara:strand:+ start:1744 stop:2301 length:558 start_codon:yes stop_codon:yes gene_type:complete
MESLLTLAFIVFAVVALILIVIYNGLVSKRNMARNAFSSIDVNLRKRHDLIPTLVNTVKGYAKHEQETLTSLVEARNQAASGNLSEKQRLRLEEQIAPRVQRLMALAESYPELRSSDHFLNLQRNLTEVEEQISASRRAYNATVFEINTSVESFPSNLIANAFGFKRHDFFEASGSTRSSVEVQL